MIREPAQNKAAPASPVAELWADMDLMNRIITAGACRSLKERERVDLQRGVESYRLKN